jgi:hypothetical protein
VEEPGRLISRQFGKDVCKRVVSLEESRKALVGNAEVRFPLRAGPSPPRGWFAPSPFQGEGRGEGCSVCSISRIFSNTALFVTPEFVVPEANDMPAFLDSSQHCPLPIVFLVFIMLPAIQFNQPDRAAPQAKSRM